MKFFMTQTREIILHSLAFVKGDILDFGAGSMKYKKYLAPRGTRYVAFDMVAGQNIDMVGDAHHPPFQDKSFDTIIMTQVLEHIAHPEIIFKELFRMLRSSGHCVITAPFLIPYHADPHDYYRYTPEGLALLAKGAGFDIVESGPYGGLFTVISEFLHFTLLNPYEKRTHPWLKEKCFNMLSRPLNFLSRFCAPCRIYAGSYIIIKKSQ